MKCWKCGTKVEERSIHHINGNPENENLSNKISLCPKCHDMIQAICDKCMNQSNCHIRKFRICWQFEDSLPPIYFSPSNKLFNFKENQEKTTIKKKSIISINSVKCGLCGGSVDRVARKDKFIICALCTQYLCKNPRIQDESFEAWANRTHA